MRLDSTARALGLKAWEACIRSQLSQSLITQIQKQRLEDVSKMTTRASIQAVFCIDVRSDLIRKCLENESPEIETYGFAGFFALPFATETGGISKSQCPVLIRPKITLKLPNSVTGLLWQKLPSFRRSAVGGFAYMEMMGPAKVFQMIRSTLGLGAKSQPLEARDLRASLAAWDRSTKIGFLTEMLFHLGLKKPYARLIVFTGHESGVTNNPQAAGLACGACGGGSGAINARVAALLFNDKELRADLGPDAPPLDSFAIAAVHDTSTDSLLFFLDMDIPSSHVVDFKILSSFAVKSSEKARRKRAESLPGASSRKWEVLGEEKFAEKMMDRASSWAETRPEWGLADNAFFIAGPRSLSKQLDLQGRAFLNSYQSKEDPTGAKLELILTAPVVVASWINLQYYASTVQPEIFGSGDKSLHTVVSGIGVAEGLTGDLRFGLAYQSVADGTGARHRPVRLQVIVAASPGKIDSILAKHASLRESLKYGWFSLVSVDEEIGSAWEWTKDNSWSRISNALETTLEIKARTGTLVQ